MIGWKRTALAGVAACLLTLSAHADVGPGLYVSESGTDDGDCTDVGTPCRSIGYALSVAGKNTRIHVAVGSYVFDDPEAILYAMSGAVHVHGGYVENDQGEWIKGGKAVLTSVPPGYREFLSMHGFTVIADAKSDDAWPESAPAMLEQHRRLQANTAAVDCVSGNAGGFSCNNIDLISHTARSSFSSNPIAVADIWGFVDLNTRREYVIVGVQNGTAVFDVSDPNSPTEVGFVGGQSATWRDIKVLQAYDDAAARWNAYAYITTDGATDGLFILDLTGLPHSISRVPYTSDFSNAHNVYLTDTDYSTGVANADTAPQLIIAGSGRGVGEYRSYDLSNPAAPQFLTSGPAGGYMHDASSVRIEDSRATDCVGSPASCTVLFDFNEQNVELWDVSNASTPSRLAVVPAYANTGYVHSGWWSEDARYLFVHDELDERNAGLPSTVRVLSVDSLVAPTLVGTWTGPTTAIDHNGFVRGNRYYVSNYARGLTILDISNPTAPAEVGFFDTYPVNDSTNFVGAWGAYPFLPSGVVAISDINSGLYLLRDQTRAVAGGQLGFSSNTVGIDEGQSENIVVTRSGGADGATSVRYELLQLTGSANDLQLTTGTLSWSDGDSADRTINISAVVDATAEPVEEFMLRLVDPQGSGALADRNLTSVFVSDAGNAAALQLDTDAVAVAESGAGLAVLTVHRVGSASGVVSVEFSINNAEATPGTDFNGPTSGTLTWTDGDARPQNVVFSVVDDGTGEPDEIFDVTFSNAVGAGINGPAVARITLLDGSGINNAPSASAGADQTRSSGSNVMLNGSVSFDPDGDALTYAWTQEGGPGVTLAADTTNTATFVAPTVSAATNLTFRLTVTDVRGLSASATTVVTVTPAQSGNNPRGASSGGGSVTLWLLLALAGFAVARTSLRRRQGQASKGLRRMMV